ncbi:MAG: ComF family protein [Nitrospirota bacterium]|nr:MAG: ComF family protein [Nitrospirota bacterium]
MQITSTILNKLSYLIDLVFPSHCPVCVKRSDNHSISPLCSSCWAKIERHNGRGCRICASVTDYDSTGVCQECRAIKPVFDRVITFGIYNGALKQTIHLMKFRRLRRLANVLGKEMSLMDIPNADVIMPVPLSNDGLRGREFNQSAVMAKVVSKETGIPLDISSLKKTKETLPQSMLQKRERIMNVKGAFEVDKDLSGKRVILVDDVITTSATVNECARALKKAGAEMVTVLTAARSKSD